LTSLPNKVAYACAFGSITVIPTTFATMGHMAGMTMPAGIIRTIAHNELSWAQAKQILRASQHEGRRRGNTVIFTGKAVAITVVANAPGHPDMSFEIGGLTNPTVAVSRGSSVTITLLNMDHGPDMDHGVVITTTAPPYPVIVDRDLAGVLARVGPLPPRSRASLAKSRYAETSARFVARRAGVYHYVCPVPDHALAYRMYGRFLVENAP